MDSLAQIDGGASKPFWIVRFKKSFTSKKSFRANYATQNVQKSISRPYFGMISTPFQLNKSRPDRQNHQDCPKTSKLNQNILKYFPEIIKNLSVASKNPSSDVCCWRATVRVAKKRYLKRWHHLPSANKAYVKRSPSGWKPKQLILLTTSQNIHKGAVTVSPYFAVTRCGDSPQNVFCGERFRWTWCPITHVQTDQYQHARQVLW